MAGVAVVAVLLGAGLLRTSGGTVSDPVGQPATAGDTPATRQAMLGEEARDGQLVFMVEDLTCGGTPGDAPQGGKLCALRFTVRNAGGAPAMLLGRFQYLVDAQSRTYGVDEPRTRAVPGNGDRSLSELTVNPDVSMALTYIFEIPDTVEPTEAKFTGTGRSRFGVNVRLQRRA